MIWPGFTPLFNLPEKNFSVQNIWRRDTWVHILTTTTHRQHWEADTARYDWGDLGGIPTQPSHQQFIQSHKVAKFRKDQQPERKSELGIRRNKDHFSLGEFLCLSPSFFLKKKKKKWLRVNNHTLFFWWNKSSVFSIYLFEKLYKESPLCARHHTKHGGNMILLIELLTAAYTEHYEPPLPWWLRQ